MNKTSKTIVFFGSGPVAAASLAALAKKFTIEAVVTKQAPAHHHGPVPVKELAEKLNLPLHFANTRRELDTLIDGLIFESRLGIIVDYGVIVSAKVIDAFPLGIINSHFSLLPEWRGADPITFTVLTGQTETGVSLMLINEALDEGQLLAQEKQEIPQDITTPELTMLLVGQSNKMLKKCIPAYISGKLTPYDQPDKPATYSRKLTKQDGILPWDQPAYQLERTIRAFIEWPKSRTTIAGKDVIITKAHVAVYELYPAEKPVAFITPDNKIGIATSDGVLVIDRLKPAGKRDMSAKEFLAGHAHLL